MPKSQYIIQSNFRSIVDNNLELVEGDYISYWKELFASTQKQLSKLLSKYERQPKQLTYGIVWKASLYSQRCQQIFQNLQISLRNLQKINEEDGVHYQQLLQAEKSLEQDYNKIVDTVIDLHTIHQETKEKIERLQIKYQITKKTILLLRIIILVLHLVNVYEGFFIVSQIRMNGDWKMFMSLFSSIFLGKAFIKNIIVGLYIITFGLKFVERVFKDEFTKK